MNAIAQPSSLNVIQHLRRASAMLRACATGSARAFAGIAYGLFAVGALLIHLAGKPVAGVFVLAMATAVLWGLWFSRILLLHIEAKAKQIPALVAELPWALGIAATLSVLLPALLLSAMGGDFVFVVSALCAAAAGALVGAMLPTSWYLAMCFAPLVILIVGDAIERQFGAHAFQLSAFVNIGQTPWLALLLALVAFWRWRMIVRHAGTPQASAMRRPMVTLALHGVGWGDAFSGNINQWRGQLPDWMWPAGKIEGGGPQRPVMSIRCVLGTPFAPLGAKQLMIQFGFGAALVIYLMSRLSDVDFQTGALIGGVMGGLCSAAAVMVLMYGQRLATVYTQSASELTELALLPGLGAAPLARRRLLQAVAWGPAAMYAIALLVFVALGLGMEMTIAAIGLLLASLLGTALMTVLACLRPLTGVATWPMRMILTFIPAALLLLINSGVVANPKAAAVAWPWLGGAWLLLYVVFGVLIVGTWRRLQARPHPFLQQ